MTSALLQEDIPKIPLHPSPKFALSKSVDALQASHLKRRTPPLPVHDDGELYCFEKENVKLPTICSRSNPDLNAIAPETVESSRTCLSSSFVHSIQSISAFKC